MSARERLLWLPAAALALLLVAAPLPFGGVVPWASAGLEAAAFVLLALGLAVGEPPRDRRLLWPALGLAGLALLGWVQSLALPEAVVGFLSPEQLRLRADLATALPLEAVAVPPALSLAPEISRGLALRFLALAALYSAVVALAARRGPRRLVALGLAAAVVVQLVMGFRAWLEGSRLLWGRLVPTDGSRLHGTFVNPNHFALYLEIALAVALAWVWWSWRRAGETNALEKRLLLAAPPILVWLGLFASLAFTGSRAGLLAAVGGTMVQAGVLWLSGRRRPASALGLGALVVAGLGMVAWVGWQQGFGRWLTTSSTGGLASRAEVYQASFELWQRFPWFGTGLGTFREAFGQVQPAGLSGSWWHAHSDWLELAATGGLVAVAILCWGLLMLARRLMEVLRRGRRSEDRAAALAACGALAVAALHEAVDFGLTMPGIAVTLVTVVALGSAATTSGPSRLA